MSGCAGLFSSLPLEISCTPGLHFSPQEKTLHNLVRIQGRKETLAGQGTVPVGGNGS